MLESEVAGGGGKNGWGRAFLASENILFAFISFANPEPQSDGRTLVLEKSIIIIQCNVSQSMKPEVLF